MAKPITLADVARKSRVSLSTASLVLRNKPGIPPDTRQRVLDAARALGYQPRLRAAHRPAAPARPAGKLHTLGLIIKSDLDDTPQANPFYSQVLAGIEAACRQQRINLLYATLPVDPENRPTEIPSLLSESQVDGLLLVGAFVDETLGHMLAERPLPVVLVDAYSPGSRYDAVVSDNFRGAYQAAAYLIERGHRRLGLVGTHPQAHPSLRERRQGYLQALLDHGVEPPLFADSSMRAPDVECATLTLLREHPEVTALVGSNDHAALAALHAAQSVGRQVPGDLSLVGFDDIELAQHVQPPLTTLRVDKVGMGRMAVHLLANRLEFPEAEQVTSLISPRLIERASVASLP